MRILCPVVQAFVRPVLDPWHDLMPGGSVRGQLIGDDALEQHLLDQAQAQREPEI
jgi:hypothetical protein